MGQRLELQALLLTIAGPEKVYFQPPENITMLYPCIVYGLDDVDTMFADNNPYNHMRSYELKVIDRDPDTPIQFLVEQLPKCEFNRHFVVDGLNHFVYKIFF